MTLGQPRVVGRAPSGCGAALSPQLLGLAFLSPLARDAGRVAGFLCSAHMRASYQDHASLLPIICAALHSFCPSLDPPQASAAGPLAFQRGGRVLDAPTQGGDGFVGCVVVAWVSWLRRSALQPRKAAKAYLFFFGLCLVVKCPGFFWFYSSPSHASCNTWI